jgi:putative aldouronate transport system permease protein
VSQWNSWFDNYLLVQNPAINTLQLILYNYLNKATALANAANDLKMHSHAMVSQVSPETIKMTITMVVTLPILFVYPFMQKYFVKGIMLGAIKG